MKRIFRSGSFQSDPATDVREELESHLEMEVEALVQAGLTVEEARAAARRKMGALGKIEMEAARYAVRLERRRRLSALVDNLRQDTAYALRTLRRAPGVTGLTLLLLALGVGANTALFSMFKGIVLEPLDLPRPHELVFLWEESPENPRVPASFANVLSWREGSRSIRDMAPYLARHVNLTGGLESVRVRGVLTSSHLFQVLGVAPELGRPLLSEEDESGIPVVVIAHDLWQGRYGGDPEIIGQDLGLDGVPHRIVGVMPRGFQQPDPNSLEPIQVWVPLPPGTELAPRRSRSYQVLGRLTEGASLEGAQEEVARVARRLSEEFPDSNQGFGIRMEAAQHALFSDAGRQILLILGAATLVLLVACGNIASLQLARASLRRGEMAVRGALGGGQGRLLHQVLTENLLLALVGGSAGILVAWGGLALLRAFAPGELPRVQTVHLDGPVLLFSLATSMVVGILFGLAPALVATRTPVATVLKEDQGRSGGPPERNRVQWAFIVGQMALSLVLGNTALLLLQSHVALRGSELGFRTADLLTMEISLRGAGYSAVRGRAEFYDELLPRLAGLPGVVAAGAATSLPLGARARAQVVAEEDWGTGPGGDGEMVESDRVAGDFFHALGIPLVSGRPFRRGEDDTGLGDSRAILNQTAASLLWPGEDPVGKRFSHAGDDPRWITVVGVVGDIRNGSLATDPLPQIYLPYASFPTGRMFLTVTSSTDPTSLVPSVLREIRDVDSRQAVSSVMTMEDVVGNQLSRREFYTTLVAAFAALALLLAGAGVFGGISQYVAGRRQELGIRMALGADAGGLTGGILKRAGTMSALGAVLGVGGACVVGSYLQAYLYEVGPLDPVTLAGGVMALILVAVLAAAGPARRACRLDPAESLNGK